MAANYILYRRLLVLRTKSKETPLQASAYQEKQNTLHLRIARFRETQVLCMPGVSELRQEGVTAATPSAYDIIHHPTGCGNTTKPSAPSPESNQPEHECIWLPSAVPADLRETVCIPGLIKMETRVQLARLDDALDDVRRQLCIAATLRDHKRSNGAGTSQRLTTKSLSVLKRFAEKLDRCTARYRAAYAALMSLDPQGEWRQRLQELKPEDVCSPHRDRDEDVATSKKKKRKAADRNRPSEGRRTLSWIWLRNGPLGRPTMENLTKEQVSDGETISITSMHRVTHLSSDMRAEWARMKARADRWSEEILWLIEEMRRILHYFQWRAAWWRKRHNRRTDASPDASRGLSAYANKQAALITALGHSFTAKWYPLHVKHGLSVEWPVEFIPTA